MKKVSATNILKNDIRQLEEKQAQEWRLLKAQLLLTYNGLKPLSILKRTISEADASGQKRNDNYFGNVLGLTAGFLSNVLMNGTVLGRAKGILSTLLQLGVSKVTNKKMLPVKPQLATPAHVPLR